MKVKAKVYKGIEFISINELPTSQQLLLQHNREPERIKILMEGKVVENCLQYSEYDKWYSFVYKRSVAPIDSKQVKEEKPQLKVSLNKA